LDLHGMIVQVNPPIPGGHHPGYWASGVCVALCYAFMATAASGAYGAYYRGETLGIDA
jgi:hypothetical protein